MQGGKSWQRTLAHLVSTALKSSTSCVISQECSMALCLLAPFGEEQKDAQQPLHPGKPGKATPAQKPPCERLCGRFGPQVGERTRPRPFRGDLGPTGPSLAERKETASSPGWGKIWGCDSQAGERPGVAHRRPVPGHLARQSRAFRDFCQASIPPFSGVGLAALGSRPGSEKQNFPVASHFCGCHRRGQRKDEEKYVR